MAIMLPLPLDRRLTESERFPLITETGQRLLRRLQEHPRAPRYNHQCGDRLTAAGRARVQAFEVSLATDPARWAPEHPPTWLADFVDFCLRDVPLYRRYGARPADFTALPTTDRADLSRAPWAFVPDSQPLDELILYATSGTTGHAINIYAHPESSVKYLPLLRAALAARGLTLAGGEGRVAIVLACFQKSTYTYAALAGYLDNAGFLKINLNPADWRGPADRAIFLDDCAPEVFTGDPISFAELAALPLRHRPKALISTSMHLTAGLRQRLQDRFECPVLDVYAMGEAGPMAVEVGRWGEGEMGSEGAGAQGSRETEGQPRGKAEARVAISNLQLPIPTYQFLQPHLYVEILDPDGAPCPPGERGEITLTGGFNPFLPLLRYRTNDYAALEFAGDQPRLVGLEGRPPVVFRAPDGRAINNIDVTHALRPLALPQYSLHQTTSGALEMHIRANAVAPALVRETLLTLFGPDQPLTLTEIETFGDKLRQYTSDLT
jgi:phenylacetate-CoA ligase